MGTPLIDDKELKNAVKELRKIPKGVNGAMSRALNDGLVVCGKVTAKEVSNEYVIKQGDVRASFKKYRANSGNLKARLVSRGKGLRLADFPYTPKQTTNRKRKSGKLYANSTVKVRVKRNEGKKVVHHSPPAFANKGGIFNRKGNKRFPIQVMYTVSIPGMVKNPKVSEVALEKASERAQERLPHHLARYLDGVIGGGK